MNGLISFAYKSNQGPHLNINEDLIDVDLPNNLFVIIDGFGGSQIGDRAANLIKDQIKKSYTKISTDPDATLPFYYSPKFLVEGNALVNALMSAQSFICKDNSLKNFQDRGGASVQALAYADGLLTIISTGNIGLYLYRNQKLSLVVVPDTVVANIPASGVGLFDDLHYQVREIKIQLDDTIVSLTDGVFAKTSEEEIAMIVGGKRDDELGMIDLLFDTANNNGNLDNQSALILQF